MSLVFPACAMTAACHIDRADLRGASDDDWLAPVMVCTITIDLKQDLL
jgi:hypothetical protein